MEPKLFPFRANLCSSDWIKWTLDPPRQLSNLVVFVHPGRHPGGGEDGAGARQPTAADRVPQRGQRHEGDQHDPRGEAAGRGEPGPAHPRPHGAHGERGSAQVSARPASRL